VTDLVLFGFGLELLFVVFIVIELAGIFCGGLCFPLLVDRSVFYKMCHSLGNTQEKISPSSTIKALSSSSSIKSSSSGSLSTYVMI
jgi:hypothetical protein